MRPRGVISWGVVFTAVVGFVAGFAARISYAEAMVDHARAAQVKAAYLRYIAELTTWPEHAFGEPGEALVIGLVGEDMHGVGRMLEDGIARVRLSAQQRPLQLLRLPESHEIGSEGEATELLRRCHVLFVSESASDPWASWRSAVDGLPIMTVGEVSGFSRSEGMIEFVISTESGRVTMHIDLAAVAVARLQISARLLALENVVHIVRRRDEARSGEFPGGVDP